jgi:hypothetical protein
MRQRNSNATAFSRNATAHRPQRTAIEKDSLKKQRRYKEDTKMQQFTVID